MHLGGVDKHLTARLRSWRDSKGALKSVCLETSKGLTRSKERVGPCSFLFGGFASGIPQVGRVHRGIECDVGRVEVNDLGRRPAK